MGADIEEPSMRGIASWKKRGLRRARPRRRYSSRAEKVILPFGIVALPMACLPVRPDISWPPVTIDAYPHPLGSC